jgi:hypothetical protein
MNTILKKSIICLGAIGLALVSFSSCEDMFNVDSSRYISVADDELTQSTDSIHSIFGILRQLQDVADRYVLLGEIRADLMDVTAYTSADIRELSTFSISENNPYVDPRDFYAIINNCNYLISNTSDANHPMKNENALAHAIRAWVYIQVACNWGKAYYFTDPLLSVEDTEKDYPALSMKELASELIAGLEPFANAAYPDYGTVYNFSSAQLFFSAKVILGDLYLWRGASVADYEQAATYYAQYIDYKRPIDAFYTPPEIAYSPDNFTGYFETTPVFDAWTNYTNARTSNPELITAIQMAEDASGGKISKANDMNYVLSFAPSQVINDLWDAQNYCLYISSLAGSKWYYTTGDLRKQANIIADITLPDINQTDEETTIQVLSKIMNTQIMVYRLPLIYLRYAEALNRAGKPNAAFAVLRNGINPVTISNPMVIPPNEYAPYISIFNSAKHDGTTGIHQRGCGNSSYDEYYHIGAFMTNPSPTREDSILTVEKLICDEMALETSFEGNRMQDLMRIALRRNDPSFLARLVSAKQEAAEQSRVYNLLTDTKNWYLPEPKIIN